MDAQALMQKITECGFALTDLHLYLDTHPKDTVALDEYKTHSQALKQLKDKYNHTYAPLHSFCNTEDDKGWQWSSSPWPWDI